MSIARFPSRLIRGLAKLALPMLCVLPPLTHAQEPEPSTATLSVNVRVVAVDALVHDHAGELVHHLTKDDFTLTDDGKSQPIHYFTEDEDLPLTIGLMVDTSSSQREFFSEQRVASKTFLTNTLTRPQDNAFIVRFDDNVLLLQRMTSDITKLDFALGKLPIAYPARPGPLAGTLLYDSICATAHNAFRDELHDQSSLAPKSQPGRRAVVILTDGDDNGSIKNRDEATECAQLANITVYIALYTFHDPGSQEEDDPRVRIASRIKLYGRTNMERISRATGGRVFVVSKALPIERIYAQIESDLRSQYRIGYTPPSFTPGSYHALELKTRDKHMKVQARIGYYTPKDAPPVKSP